MLKPVEQQLEIVIGSDNVVRVNVDGLNITRYEMAEGCELKIRLQDGTEISKIIEVI